MRYNLIQINYTRIHLIKLTQGSISSYIFRNYENF